MSTSEAERFIQSTKTDSELLARIEKAGSDPKVVFELVRSEGYDCTADEIQTAFLEEYGSHLTSEQLEAIAGGEMSTETAIGIGVGGGVGAIVVGGTIAASAVAAGAV